MQPISHLLLEMFVLSKPYFDRHGLIVAVDDNGVVGFVHAGFGPDPTRTQLSNELGVVCVLAVRAHEQRGEILRGLLARAESYLQDRGARKICIGSTFPFSPFYLGLHGGSDLPGVSTKDTEMEQLFAEAGYREIGRWHAFERTLHRFRVPVDRRLMQHRRTYRLIPQVNPPNLPWWDACVFGPADRIRFLLESKTGGGPCGEITYWDMGPLSTRAQYCGMGIISWSIDVSARGQGLGTFLATESLKHLQNSGIPRIEVQTGADNEQAPAPAATTRLRRTPPGDPLRERPAIRRRSAADRRRLIADD